MMAQDQIADASGEIEMADEFTIDLQGDTGSASRVPRVLIADDQWNICEALRLLLRGEGYEIASVSGPSGLLDQLHSRAFDLVLLDLNYTRDTTSGREGLELLTQIRDIDPDLPVLVMTAWSNLDLAIEALRRGARDFIQKPWNNQEVLHSVRAHVQRHRLLCQRRRTLQEEVREAVAVQRMLLPDGLPQPPGCAIAGAYLPAHFVGGDYFDVVEQNGQTAICVADVSGKGLPAALVMANLQAALKSQLLQDPSPAAVCRHLNRVLNQPKVTGRFVSFFHGLLRDQARRLQYCNAGHLPPILVHANGSYERLSGGGAVLGYFEAWNYEEQEAELEAGSRLLLFTDGIVDGTNASGEEFGEERLIETAVANHGLDAEDLKQALLSAFLAHCGGKAQDDATLVVIAVN